MRFLYKNKLFFSGKRRKKADRNASVSKCEQGMNGVFSGKWRNDWVFGVFGVGTVFAI